MAKKKSSEKREKEKREDVEPIENGTTKAKKRKASKDSIKEEDNLADFIKNPLTVAVLQKKGIKNLFPIQEKCYAPILNGEDLIGKDRTGSGKTLAYSVPIVELLRNEGKFKQKNPKQKPFVLVMIPTRELCIQVTTEIISIMHSEKEFRVAKIYGGADIKEQINQLRQGVEIVVGTPGRLQDLYERGILSYNDLRIVVLDEADQMLQVGFQEDIQKIFKTISDDKSGEKTQNILFSATIPSWLHEIASEYMNKEHQFIDMVKDFNMSATASKIDHFAINCPYFEVISCLGDVILTYGGGQFSRCIVFCERKSEANDVMLKSDIKQDMQVLHGDIPQKQREIVFQGFKEGKFKCLVATNVAARGLDIPQIDLVIQLEPPKELDTYVHRAGRTARAGRSGKCITFYGLKHKYLLEKIERGAKIKLNKVGAPQPKDIIEAQSRDIAQSLKSVNPKVLSMFKETAEDLVKELGATEALERAFAFIAGVQDQTKQRSLLCSMQGFITYEIKMQKPFHANSFVFNYLRNHFDQTVLDTVKGMKITTDGCGAVFDVDHKHKDTFEEYIQNFKDGKIKFGNEIKVCEEIPEIKDEFVQKATYSTNRGSAYNPQTSRMPNADRKKLEVFIGNLGFGCDDNAVQQFFQSKGVCFQEIRHLKNEAGESKGAAFGLCKDQQIVERVIKLNGQSFNRRQLRINRADDKPSR